MIALLLLRPVESNGGVSGEAGSLEQLLVQRPAQEIRIDGLIAATHDVPVLGHVFEVAFVGLFKMEQLHQAGGCLGQRIVCRAKVARDSEHR